jgi:ribosomal protein S18 acetylase RimI-like enzyme
MIWQTRKSKTPIDDNILLPRNTDDKSQATPNDQDNSLTIPINSKIDEDIIDIDHTLRALKIEDFSISDIYKPSHRDHSFFEKVRKEFFQIASKGFFEQPRPLSDILKIQTILAENNLEMIVGPGKYHLTGLNTEREINALKSIYKYSFTKFDTMTSWVDTFKNMGCLEKGELIGGATFKEIIKDEGTYIDLLLIAVKETRRNEGIAKMIINNLKQAYKRIVLYSDKSAQGFYEKLGFVKDSRLLKSIWKDVLYETNSVFMSWGFR